MTTVSELRKELIDLGLPQPEVDSIKGKQNLIDKITEMRDEPSLDIESLEESTVEETVFETVPERGTKEWTDYIISHCTENELKQGCPTCDALRRLTEKFVGEIVYQGVITSHTYLDQFYSTVVYEIRIVPLRELGNSYINIDSLPVKVYREVADSCKGNTKTEYTVHPSATASTRAESRCYRKALKLTVLSAEEMDNDKNPREVIEEQFGRKEEIDNYIKENITGAQISLIESRAKNLNVSIDKLLKEAFEDKYIDINQLSREDGNRLSDRVNELQQAKKVPEELLND